MNTRKPQWEQYEKLARQVLRDAKSTLKLSRVEPKQKMPGDSGTDWEIDLVAYDRGSEKLVLVECKMRSEDTLNQETVGGFAYRIQDARAKRGILVTTIGLQEGAKKIADHEEIATVLIDGDDDPENYVATVAGQIFAKATTDMFSVEPNVEVLPPPRKVTMEIGSGLSTEVTVTPRTENDASAGTS